MSLRYEQYASMRRTRSFLSALLDPRQTPRVPRAARKTASDCLHHFPCLRDSGEPMWSMDKIKQPDKRWRNMSLSATRPGDGPVCDVCKGKGLYAYDENHAKPCEYCCKHDKGWWELTPMFEHYEAGKDNSCCLAGCGTMRRDLPDAPVNNNGNPPLTWEGQNGPCEEKHGEKCQCEKCVRPNNGVTGVTTNGRNVP